MRGVLTDKIQAVAVATMGREINTTELRMMPYVQYLMVNDQRIDPNKCNGDDRLVLKLWRKEGHIEGGASGLYITRDFWNTINNLIWHAYVASVGGELIHE